MLKGVTGSIKGARDKIQNLLNKVLDFIDYFAMANYHVLLVHLYLRLVLVQRQKVMKNQQASSQYKVKPPNSVSIIGNGNPIKGFVPAVDVMESKYLTLLQVHWLILIVQLIVPLVYQKRTLIHETSREV